MIARSYRWMCLAIAALAVVGGAWLWQGGQPSDDAVTLVRIPSGRLPYRLSGEFTQGGQPVDAPLREIEFSQPIDVMRHQVSEADFERCVVAGACDERSKPYSVRADFPVTGVSWADARVYARWLSQQTGHLWRLPTDAEWSYVAGSRYHDDALLLGDNADVIMRWMARFDREARRETQGYKPERIGTFGANEHGLTDLAGNIWEWTDSCLTRQELAEGNKPFAICGIRVAAGQHRVYLSDFIRDARGGGCAVGIPPSNLGFRLIRDKRLSVWARLNNWIGRTSP